MVNIYAPNVGVARYRNQWTTNILKLTDTNTMTGDFHAHLEQKDRSSKQKINRGAMARLTPWTRRYNRHIQNISSYTSRIHIPFTCTSEILQNRSHHGPQISLNRYEKAEIIPRTFSAHDTMKLEVNHKEKLWKYHKYLQIKEHPTREWMGNPEIKEIIKI